MSDIPSSQIELPVRMPGLVSAGNSTSAVLGANGVFTGVSEEVLDYSTISIQVFTNQASATLGFKAQYSADNLNWDDGDSYTIPAAVAADGKFFTFPPQARYFKLTYTNGAVAQTIFRLQTVYHYQVIKMSSHRVGDTLNDDNDAELVKANLIARRTDGVSDNVKLTNNADLSTADLISNSAVHGAISVSTTAVEAKVGAAALVNRKSLTVCPTNGTVYFGFNSSVTVATGTPIIAGNLLPFGFQLSVFLIATATTDVRITEAS